MQITHFNGIAKKNRGHTYPTIAGVLVCALQLLNTSILRETQHPDVHILSINHKKRKHQAF